jgi:iron complex outermembrane recepter protein
MYAGGSRAARSRQGLAQKYLLPGSRSLICLVMALVFTRQGGLAADNSALPADIASLKTLPIEDLLKVEVTSVSRRRERLLDVPSAIQVITSEDIRRSGATSLPEALRLAPNLQVAQIDSRQWAVSSRGFNSATSDKLLVLIDGRTVYTPLFSGVFWDVQNVMLEDVDRIEVISGPGASLWGGNAVNGVINVVSKNARDTQGTLLSGGGGSLVEGLGAVRYGGKIGKDLYFRLYGFGSDRGGTVLPSGKDANNDWRLFQGGFRGDWLPPHGEIVTLQGDFYGGRIGVASGDDTTVNGQDLLGRWTHAFREEVDMTLQLYWDRTWRRIPNVFSEELNTYDLDFQNRIAVLERHKFIWGAGYRLYDDDVGNTPSFAFLPAAKTFQVFSGFLQDEIELVDNRLFLTLGTKLEHNDFSGFEVQPSVRMAWKPRQRQTLWAAVSRALRTPSRIDTDLRVPITPPYAVAGAGDLFKSEKLMATELGYRIELSSRLSIGLSTFYNDYDELRSVEPVPGGPGQTIIYNGLRGESYGAEFSATYQPVDWWRLRGGYTWFKKHIAVEEKDINQGRGQGNDPRNHFLAQSTLNLPANIEFDQVLRYTDNLNQLGPTVPSYLSLDLRLAWHPHRDLEIAIVGQNLLDKQHAEFGLPGNRQEIPRSVYGKITLKF